MLLRALLIVFIASLALAHANASQRCVRYIEARSNPLYPPGHGTGSGMHCVDDRTTARHILQKRLEARCATRPTSTSKSTVVSRSVGLGLGAMLGEAVTALTLLGLPLVIGVSELSYISSNGSGGIANRNARGAPYTAFVVLACVLHLIVVTALYGGDTTAHETPHASAGASAKAITNSRALFDTECCMQGSRFLLRQPLCGGGALIARVEPPISPMRLAVVRAVAVFTAAAWAACAVSVLRARAAARGAAGAGVRSWDESVPLLGGKASRR